MADVNNNVVGVNGIPTIDVPGGSGAEPENGISPQVICKLGCHGIDYSGHRPATDAEIEMLTLIADLIPGPPVGKGVKAGDSFIDKVVGLIEHASPQKSRRYLRGTASFSDLPVIREGDRWLRGTELNAGKVPRQVAEKLAGESFSSFDAFRKAFWKEVANDPVLSKQLDFGDNLKKMRNGNAPSPLDTQSVGKRAFYEIDHVQEIQHGGNVYDMDNMVIRTTLNHIKGK